MSTFEDFIEETTAHARPLEHAVRSNMWQAATTGAKDALDAERESRAALLRFWANRELLERAQSLLAAYDGTDPITARCLKVIQLAAAEAQQDEATIDEITALEAQVRDAYYNFRGEVDGERLSDNALDDLLRTTTDPSSARNAWEASKQIGMQVADDVRALTRLRNRAAQAHGYRDHFARALAVHEIEEDFLFRLFADLETASRGPFKKLLAEISASRAAHFKIDLEALQPWHYADRFFQSAAAMGETDLDALFSQREPMDLALQTYDGLGLEVRDILARSDLYEREGKNQHAFCLDVDRSGDIRTLNNLQPNHRWTQTLLHELGHAVYNLYIDQDLPWLLRKPPHLLSTEAIALLMGALTLDSSWLREVAGVPLAEAETLVSGAQARKRAGHLIFTRWVLVMVHFERTMYSNPNQDLNTLWWQLVERFQGLKPPEGRNAPDWAAKYHIPLAPVYYQNYELGLLVAAQLEHHLRQEIGDLVGRKEAGAWLVERVFHAGASFPWDQHVGAATGEPLDPAYFVASLAA